MVGLDCSFYRLRGYFDLDSPLHFLLNFKSTFQLGILMDFFDRRGKGIKDQFWKRCGGEEWCPCNEMINRAVNKKNIYPLSREVLTIQNSLDVRCF